MFIVPLFVINVMTHITILLFTKWFSTNLSLFYQGGIFQAEMNETALIDREYKRLRTGLSPEWLSPGPLKFITPGVS